MKASTLFNFLDKNTDMKSHDIFIKKALMEVEAEGWKEGYSKCLMHTKKRRNLEEKRKVLAVKKLIDYISDLTHKST